jgi:hypothetical protein
MKIFPFLCTLLLVLAQSALAVDYGDLYDDATLTQWQASFEQDLVWNFHNAVFPNLTPEEKRALRHVKIDVPLRGEKRQVFEFYTDGTRVVMPVLSLRFFGDLALAYAWLNEHGYNLETIQQYVGMIHSRSAERFAGRQYPRPLDALQIPADARQNAKVVDSFDKTFASAMIFILCHELGHIYHQHPGYDKDHLPEALATIAQANEAEADRFAVEIMRRMGDIPAGTLLWFASAVSAHPHRVDFASEKEWQDYRRGDTHPLTADRLDSLSTAIDKAALDFAQKQDNPAAGLTRVQDIAANIREVADILKGEGIHRLFRAQSATTEPTMLAPRRSMAFSMETGNEPAADTPFSGVFEGELSSHVNKESIPIRVVLQRKGDMVVGNYTYALFAGKVRGVVEDRTIYLDWTERGVRGKAKFKLNEDGKSFTGTWGNDESRDNGGSWSGKPQ